MKKELMFMCAIMMALLGATTVSAAIIGYSPINNSVNSGNTSEQFCIVTSAPILSATTYVDLYGYSMSALNATTWCASADLSLKGDNTAHDYFFVYDSNFYPSATTKFAFGISRAPSQITGLLASSISESEISLSWNANLEPDFASYKVYRNGTNIANTSTPSYINNGLTIGDNWCYTISAVDSYGLEGLQSVQSCALVQDLTAPLPPVFTNTISGTAPINTGIDYTENVSLQIVYGTILIQDMGIGQNFIFTTNPAPSTRNYQAKACDSYNNCLITNFSVTLTSPPIIFNASTIDVPYMNAPQARMIKNTAKRDGTDYWLMEHNLTYYQYCGIRPAMSDITGNSGAVMFVNEDIQPATSCSQSALILDYYLDNTEDLLQAALDGTCVDLDPSGAVKKTIYTKIPVMAGVPLDTWQWNYDWYGHVC